MEEGRKVACMQQYYPKSMLKLLKYARKAAIYMKNVGLLGHFKATEKYQHDRIEYSRDQNSSLIDPHRGDRRGKSWRKPPTENRREPHNLIAVSM